MSKGRLEAFSDGVIAIIITIMVLELHTPEGADLNALIPLIPIFLSYALSFVFIGIYWNNHHHLFQAAHRVNGRVLWVNLLLLFWLSLVPFVTNWLGEHPQTATPVALYGGVLWLAGFSYYVVAQGLVGLHDQESALVQAIGNDIKGKISLVLYTTAIPLAFVNTWLSIGLYLVVAVMWLIPDSRIERILSQAREDSLQAPDRRD
jgi:uncharacterized membrane protein